MKVLSSRTKTMAQVDMCGVMWDVESAERQGRQTRLVLYVASRCAFQRLKMEPNGGRIRISGA